MKKVKNLIKPLVIIAFFIVIGLIIFYFLDKNIKQSFNVKIEQTSNITMAAISPESVRNLAAIIPGDITNSDDYARLREQITKLGNAFLGDGIDAVYLLTKKDNKIYFIVESTPADQPGAVIPGVLYEKAPQEAYNVFAHGTSLLTGVYSDEYGQYLSQFTSVIDSVNNEQVGVLGVDVDYAFFQKTYYEQIAIFFIIWTIICIFCVFLYLYFRGISELNTEDRVSNEKVNSVSNAINDCVIVIDNKSLVYFWNKASEHLLHLSSDKLLGYKFSDLVKIQHVYDLKLEKEIPDFSFSFSSGLSGRIFELEMIVDNEEPGYYEASFKIAEVGDDNYLVGVFHDISKRKNIETELKNQKSDLEKINQLMVGRELKMLELKQKIAGLNNKE